MLSRLILASLTQNEAPDDPALWVQWLLGDALSDLLDGLDDVA